MYQNNKRMKGKEKNMSTTSNKTRKIEHWQVVTLLLIIYDFAAVILSYGLALWVRFDCKMSMVEQKYFQAYSKSILFYAAFCVVMFWFMRLYKSIWRFASYAELLRVILATIVTGCIHIIVVTICVLRMPISYYMIGITIQFILTLGIRFSYRFVLLLRGRSNKSDKEKKVGMLPFR